MQRKHVIFGAGALGLSIMRCLPSSDTIVLVNRSGKLNTQLPQGVALVALDATDKVAVFDICQNADVVYHCAVPAYHQWEDMFLPLTQGILQGVSHTGARLIYADNLYMYGDTDGKAMTESSLNLATGKKGMVRMKMSHDMIRTHKRGDIQVAIARASDFYGPNVINSVLGEVCFEAALRNKTVNLFGNIDLPHSYTYIMDFAKVMIILGWENYALGNIWHVPNAPVITTRQFVALVEEELGQKIHIRTLGKNMLKFIGLFDPKLREFKEMMYAFEKPFLVKHEKFQAKSNFKPTPFFQGVKNTVQWYQKGFGK